jgi:hypothetical protein
MMHHIYKMRRVSILETIYAEAHPLKGKIIAGLAERYAISAVKIMPDAVVKGCGKNGAKENR